MGLMMAEQQFEGQCTVGDAEPLHNPNLHRVLEDCCLYYQAGYLLSKLRN